MPLKSILAAIVLICFAAVAQAQEARVVVPDAPGGADLAGCYRADRPLYGPHRVVMCFERGRAGTYKVRGPDLRCDGRLSWRLRNGTLDVSLRRQSCNRGLAWAAATVECRPRGLVSAILDELIRDLASQDRTRVVVPDRPTVGRLNCTYLPTVAGAADRQFFAYRVLVRP